MSHPLGALASILPARAVGAELVENDGEEHSGALYEDELAAVADAGDGRRREFAAGRICARRALESLGVSPRALPVGGDGAPVWPDGVVGSITHKGRYRAAAVAFSRDLRGLGIDAEMDRPLPAGVLATVASPRELDEVEELLAALPGTAWDRLLFSAKESVVKAARPRAGGSVGLRSVELRLDPAARVFSAREAPFAAEGTWTVSQGLLLTTASSPR